MDRRKALEKGTRLFSAFRWAGPGRAFFRSVFSDGSIEKFHVVLKG
jgi:hypothetical protein